MGRLLGLFVRDILTKLWKAVDLQSSIIVFVNNRSPHSSEESDYSPTLTSYFCLLTWEAESCSWTSETRLWTGQRHRGSAFLHPKNHFSQLRSQQTTSRSIQGNKSRKPGETAWGNPHRGVTHLMGCRSNMGGCSSASSMDVMPTAQMSHSWL